jgi:hypothetical protein
VKIMSIQCSDSKKTVVNGYCKLKAVSRTQSLLTVYAPLSRPLNKFFVRYFVFDREVLMLDTQERKIAEIERMKKMHPLPSAPFRPLSLFFEKITKLATKRG